MRHSDIAPTAAGCENCDAQWTKHDYDCGERGEWFDDAEDLPQCGAERWSVPLGTHPEPWPMYRCVLHEGHEGDELGDHIDGSGYRFDARTRDEALAIRALATQF